MSNHILDIALTVNGERVRQHVDARKTLVDFLREELVQCLLVPVQARIPVRPDWHDACITTQRASRNIRASNENPS